MVKRFTVDINCATFSLFRAIVASWFRWRTLCFDSQRKKDLLRMTLQYLAIYEHCDSLCRIISVVTQPINSNQFVVVRRYKKLSLLFMCSFLIAVWFSFCRLNKWPSSITTIGPRSRNELPTHLLHIYLNRMSEVFSWSVNVRGPCTGEGIG